MKLPVYNLKAEACGEIELDEDYFDFPYNEAVVHESIVNYLNCQRQGTKSALTRSEVRGHAKKPWRQKHTGRARHGSTKAPQWTGGGIVFAPKPRDFSTKMNKQAKRLAFFSAMSQKIRQGQVFVVENVDIELPKTKLMQEVLNNFKFDGKTIIVTKVTDEKAMRASGNIPYVDITTSNILNTYDIVSNKNVLITVEALKYIEEER